MREQSPRERVLAKLRGEKAQEVLTIYESLFSSTTHRERMAREGVCIIERVRSYELDYPNAKYSYEEKLLPNGNSEITTHIVTDKGEVSQIQESNNYTTWTKEHFFKDENDYKALKCWLSGARVRASYGVVEKLIDNLSDSYLVRDNLPLEPLQGLISNIFGTEKFCYEYMDNQDEIMDLYEIERSTNRLIYPIVASSPLEHCNYGGNVVPTIIGTKAFEELYLPNYYEASEILHKSGKMIGSHFDADNTLIMDMLAKSTLDYIEAYDERMSPDLTKADMLRDKVIWCNFPSSTQLCSEQEMIAEVNKLIEIGKNFKGLIVGITEDVPQDRVENNYNIINTAVGNYNKKM